MNTDRLKALVADFVAAHDAQEAHFAAHVHLPRAPGAVFASVEDERTAGALYSGVLVAEKALLDYARANRAELAAAVRQPFAAAPRNQ